MSAYEITDHYHDVVVVGVERTLRLGVREVRRRMRLPEQAVRRR